MSQLTALSKHTVVDSLIAFVDLTLYTKTCMKLQDPDIAKWMDGFFEQLSEIVESKEGAIVKFIGDAALIVFDGENAEAGILCLLEAKEKIDRWMRGQGFHSRLHVKIHFGSVVAGPFGGRRNKRFDVIGKAVNTAATLDGQPFVMSVQAFRQLSAAGRKHFKKHTGPLTYIRTEDSHD